MNILPSPNTRPRLAPVAAGAALALCLLAPAAQAAIQVTLGDITITEGQQGGMPFTLLVDADVSLVSFDLIVTFDTTRIAFDPDVPLFGNLVPVVGGYSLNQLNAVPDFSAFADADGVRVSGSVPDTLSGPFIELTPAAPYAGGSLRFSGLLAGGAAVPVSVRLEYCDLTACFFDTLVPEVALAGGSVTVNAIPEPATWALFGLGLLAVGRLARRRGATR